MRCLQIFALLGALALVQGIAAVQDEQALKDVLRELTELLEARDQVKGHHQSVKSYTDGGTWFGRATQQPGGVTENHQDEVTGHQQTGQSYTSGGNSFGRVTNQPNEVTGHHQTGGFNTNGGNSYERATNQPDGVTGHHQNTESNTNSGHWFGRVTNQPGDVVTGHQITERNTNGGNSFGRVTNQPDVVSGHHQTGQSYTNGGNSFGRITNQPDVVTGHQATERNTNGGNGLELVTQRPGGFTGNGNQATEGNNEMDTYTTAEPFPLVCKYNKKGKLKCRRRKPRKNQKKSLELEEEMTDSKSLDQEQALKGILLELKDVLEAYESNSLTSAREGRSFIDADGGSGEIIDPDFSAVRPVVEIITEQFGVEILNSPLKSLPGRQLLSTLVILCGQIPRLVESELRETVYARETQAVLEVLYQFALNSVRHTIMEKVESAELLHPEGAVDLMDVERLVTTLMTHLSGDMEDTMNYLRNLMHDDYENVLMFVARLKEENDLFNMPVGEALPLLQQSLIENLGAPPRDGAPPAGSLLPVVARSIAYLVDRLAAGDLADMPLPVDTDLGPVGRHLMEEVIVEMRETLSEFGEVLRGLHEALTGTSEETESYFGRVIGGFAFVLSKRSLDAEYALESAVDGAEMELELPGSIDQESAQWLLNNMMDGLLRVAEARMNEGYSEEETEAYMATLVTNILHGTGQE